MAPKTWKISSPAADTLAKAVFAHSQGRIYDRSDAAQQKRAMALNTVIAAIVFWNTLYMEKAAGIWIVRGRSRWAII